MLGFAITPILIILGALYWFILWFLPIHTFEPFDRILTKKEKIRNIVIFHLIATLFVWLCWGVYYLTSILDYYKR